MVSDTIGDTVGLSADQRNLQFRNLYPGLANNPIQDGSMIISTYDLTGRFREDITVNVTENMGMNTLIDEINAQFAANDVDARAFVEMGTLKIEAGNSGNGGEEVGAALVKVDNSLVLEALDITAYKPLDLVDKVDIPFEIRNGTFHLNVYNDNGTVLASREITINKESENPLYSTMAGIVAQMNMANIDDNQDNDMTNDVDDLVSANFANNRFHIGVKDENGGVFFNLTDEGNTGFAGAIGLHKFFSGDSAKDMDLVADFREHPSLINAYQEPVEGNNSIANAMVQLQYEDVPFYGKDGFRNDETIIGQYRFVAGSLANDTYAVRTARETAEAVHSSIKSQMQSISSVNIDEELANLIKFQTGYGANAKVLTTVQQMLDTLLSIKQ